MKTQFYKKTWFIVVMLICITPVGIFLMYKYTAWNEKLKLVISIISALIFIIVLIPGAKDKDEKEEDLKASSKEETPIEYTQEQSQEPNTEPTIAAITPEPIEIIDYNIIEKVDVSYGNVKRYDYRVVIYEEANKEQLKVLASYIAENAKKENKFNALSIGFFDYEEYVEYEGYVLGNAVYAPGGSWDNADSVKTGEYDSMYLNTSSLKEKDWTLRLSQDEVDIYSAWNKLYYEKEALIDKNTTEMVDEDEVNEEVAKQFNMSKEEVADIIWKQVIWVMDDGS